VAIAPSAGAALKSWPTARWAALGDRLNGAVLLVGAPTDETLLRRIQGAMTRPSTIACGQNLEASAALFERCQLLIGPDGGAAHLAAAVGTATVRLYGPASSTVFGPWPRAADQQVLVTGAFKCVPCGYLENPPCGARVEPACLLALGIEDVLAASEN
jgi:ADP-heptose:LPS heptosyltransferase